jgi:signal peptidase I
VFLKRIVAGPGDTITIRAGHLIRDGVAVAEPYATACPSGQSLCDCARSARIPPGHWFVLGDNRFNSQDSRFWGPVASSWIIGVVSWRYWPLDRLGSL